MDLNLRQRWSEDGSKSLKSNLQVKDGPLQKYVYDFHHISFIKYLSHNSKLLISQKY